MWAQITSCPLLQMVGHAPLMPALCVMHTVVADARATLLLAVDWSVD